MGRVALITGITGQDGSYLAELLLNKGYEVFGLVRRLSTPNYERIAHIMGNITILQGDLLDSVSMVRAIDRASPDEIYNLAAMSHVGTSFDHPISTGEYNGLGVARLLEAMRICGSRARFYQASTSEMFGDGHACAQNEYTTFHPRSPYGISKLCGYWFTVNYREAYGMHCSNGILFNHESPRRGIDFVTRKITRGVASIALGLQKTITLGNLESKRDWGFAGDYVRAMWLMLQQEKPDDYVIATGETHSIREFLEIAFHQIGVHNWQDCVTSDPTLYRPSDISCLVGDARKARNVLTWEPSVSFIQLVSMMVQADIEALSNAESVIGIA